MKNVEMIVLFSKELNASKMSDQVLKFKGEAKRGNKKIV